MFICPERGWRSRHILIELKFDRTAQSALMQIKERQYGRIFEDYTGEVLLVGINYSKESKRHDYLIERLNLQKQ